MSFLSFIMKRRYREEKKLQKYIARHRIHYLFSIAKDCAFAGMLNLSDRYVKLARKISMKYLVPIPVEYTRQFCKHCYCYLLPSSNCRVRIHHSIIITYCSNCKKFNRIPIHRRSSTSNTSKIKN